MDHRFGVAYTYPAVSDPAPVVQAAGVTRWYKYLAPGEPINTAAYQMALVTPRADNLPDPGWTDAQIELTARNSPDAYWLVGNEPNNPFDHYQTPADYAALLNRVVTIVRQWQQAPIFIGPQVWNWTDRLGEGGLTGQEFTVSAMAAYESAYGGWPCSALSLHIMAPASTRPIRTSTRRTTRRHSTRPTTAWGSRCG